MAEITLAAGGKVDIATGPELQQGLKHIESVVQALQQEPVRPGFHPFIWQDPIPSSPTVPYVITIRGPGSGMVADLRRLVVTGIDDHTPVPNVMAAVYVSETEGSPAGGGPPLSDLVAPGQTIPASFYFSRYQATLIGRQNLLVLLYGSGVGGTTITVAGQALLVPDTPQGYDAI